MTLLCSVFQEEAAARGRSSGVGGGRGERGRRREKPTCSNFQFPQEQLEMPEGFWHMLEKLTISEMARYPESRKG